MNPSASGGSTSELKLSAAVLTVVNLLYAVLLALANSNPNLIPGTALAVISAIIPVLNGGVAINYTRSRTALKVAAVSTTGASASTSLDLETPTPMVPDNAP